MKIHGWPVFDNDLPDRVLSSLKVFRDDTKLWRTIADDSYSSTLHNYLNHLTEWSRDLQLKYNPSKCKLTHIGHKCHADKYMNEDTGNRSMLEEVKEEKNCDSKSGMIKSQMPSVSN